MTANKSVQLFKIGSAAAIGVVFFFLYSFLPLSVSGVYNSPDENSNAVFAEQVALNGQLHRIDSLNVRLHDRIHPRSVKVVDGLQVPGGFLGLPVMYGWLAKVFGVGALPYMTPVFALFGVLAWGLIVQRYYGSRAGLLAALLLLTNVVWWYWASRSLMPNVLLVSLLLMAAYFLLRAPAAAFTELYGYGGLGVLRRADGIIAGVLLGCALAVRPVALYWLTAGAVAFLLLAWRRIAWGRVALCLVMALLTLAPFLIMNHSLYGSPFATGYGDVVATVQGDPHGGIGAKLLGPLRPILFPLSFAPRIAVANFWTYGVSLVWWWTCIVMAAAVYLSIKVMRRRQLTRDAKIFLVVALAIAAYIIPLYGSWRIQDSLDPSAISLGSSYLRYWLPLFVLSTLPVSLAMDQLLKGRKIERSVSYVILFVVIVASFGMVFSSEREGLSAVHDNLIKYKAESQKVFELTEENSLIVVDYADKYLYPRRSVVYPLREEITYELLPEAVAAGPTYYFGLTLPQEDVHWLQTKKLPTLGLTIEPLAQVEDKTLYQFRKLND